MRTGVNILYNSALKAGFSRDDIKESRFKDVPLVGDIPRSIFYACANRSRVLVCVVSSDYLAEELKVKFSASAGALVSIYNLKNFTTREDISNGFKNAVRSIVTTLLNQYPKIIIFVIWKDDGLIQSIGRLSAIIRGGFSLNVDSSTLDDILICGQTPLMLTRLLPVINVPRMGTQIQSRQAMGIIEISDARSSYANQIIYTSFTRGVAMQLLKQITSSRLIYVIGWNPSYVLMGLRINAMIRFIERSKIDDGRLIFPPISSYTSGVSENSHTSRGTEWLRSTSSTTQRESYLILII